jgi:hypothetical protein
MWVPFCAYNYAQIMAQIKETSQEMTSQSLAPDELNQCLDRFSNIK